MFGGDGVLPSGVALASDDSFAPMVTRRSAASSFLGRFESVRAPLWLDAHRRANLASSGNTLESGLGAVQPQPGLYSAFTRVTDV